MVLAKYNSDDLDREPNKRMLKNIVTRVRNKEEFKVATSTSTTAHVNTLSKVPVGSVVSGCQGLIDPELARDLREMAVLPLTPSNFALAKLFKRFFHFRRKKLEWKSDFDLRGGDPAGMYKFTNEAHQCGFQYHSLCTILVQAWGGEKGRDWGGHKL